MLAELKQKARARPELDPVQLPTFTVSSDEEAAAAIDRIVTYFGEDPTRAVVRLVLHEQDVRYLEREDVDVYLLEESDDKGLGDSWHASLPGYSPLAGDPDSSMEYEFRCPVAGCPDSPVFVMTFTEPPVCRVHGQTLELVP
jgi:hypothetical protein